MDKLIKEIEDKVNEISFSGVISISKQNEIIYNKAFGYRDIKNKLPNQTDTKFGIASGTKLFTALGIGKLIDDKVISLQTKVKDIDKSFTGFIDENAAILNLLTHTSGMYDYLDEEIIEDYENFHLDKPWYDLTTPTDYLPLFKDKQMKFAPNNRFSYSNGGYVLLGIIIERLTGKLYRDYLKETILNPIGMTDSYFYAFNDLPENTAFGYLEDRKTTNIYRIPIRGGGDGGMYTTTQDLRLFWQAFLSNKILSEELTRAFLKTHIKINEKIGYGCGLYKHLQGLFYSIVGMDAGVGFDSRYLLIEDIVVNILSNITGGEGEIRKLVLDYIYSNR